MRKALWDAVKGLVGSKKFLAACVSAAVWLGGKAGLDLDADELLPAVAPFWGYILAQMGSDWGKEKAKLEAPK